MANSKISVLTALTAVATDDVLPIVDTSAAATKGITVANLFNRTVSSSPMTFSTITGTGASRGPFVMSHNEVTSQGQVDPAFGIHYNATADGNQIVAGEGTFGFNFEGHWISGSGQPAVFEGYIQGISTSGRVVRPIFINQLKGTGVCTIFCKADGYTFFYDDGLSTGETSTLTAFSIVPNQFVFRPKTAANNDFLIGSGAGFGVSLRLGYNADDNYFRLSTGSNSATVMLNSQQYYFNASPSGGAGAAFMVGTSDNQAAGVFKASHGSMRGLVAIALAASAQDTFQVQASDGTTVRFAVDANGKTLIGVSGTAISKYLSATTTWDASSVADGAMTSTTVTVTGAALGDAVAVGMSVAVPAGCILSGSVTATNTVTVTLFNKSGGAVDLTSGTLRASVIQH